MKKKLFSMCFLIGLIFMSLSVSVEAEDSGWNLGSRFDLTTSEDKNLYGEGRMVWDADSKTLYLTDYTEDCYRDDKQHGNEIFFRVPDGTTIVLSGTNKIGGGCLTYIPTTSDVDPYPVAGILAEGKLTITGDGTLTVYGPSFTSTKVDAYAGSIAGCYSHGIYAAGELTICGGATVYAYGGRAAQSYGIRTNDSGTDYGFPKSYLYRTYKDVFTIDNASVTAVGGKCHYSSSYWGISYGVVSGNPVVKNGGILNAIGGSTEEGWVCDSTGLVAVNSVTVDNASIVATGGTVSSGRSSVGLQTGYKSTDVLLGTVNLINDGTLTATGSGAAFKRYSSDTYIPSGEDYMVIASTNLDGSDPVEYDSSAISAYKYLKMEAFSCEAPTITKQPKNISCYVDDEAILTVEANVTDYGALSYEWYSNTTNSTTGGTKVASTKEYVPSTAEAGTTYYYCKIKNSLEGTKIAYAYTDVVKVVVTEPPRYTATLNTSGLTGATASLNSSVDLLAHYEITLAIIPDEGKTFKTMPTVSVTGATAGKLERASVGAGATYGEMYCCQITSFTADAVITVSGTAVNASTSNNTGSSGNTGTTGNGTGTGNTGTTGNGTGTGNTGTTGNGTSSGNTGTTGNGTSSGNTGTTGNGTGSGSTGTTGNGTTSGSTGSSGNTNTDPTASPKLKKGKTNTVKSGKQTIKYVVTKNKNGKVEVAVKSATTTSTTITIPATVKIANVQCKVTAIKEGALKNNKKIKKVTIGSNVKTIGQSAFYGCTKLTTVTIGKNVTTIGDKAFYKCTALKSITIPSKVTKIGKQAFYKCKNLKTIKIKTTKLTSKNVGKEAFTGIYKKATVKVPAKKVSSYKTLLVKKGVSKSAKIKKY